MTRKMLKADLEKFYAALLRENKELTDERDRLSRERTRYKNVAESQVHAAEHLNQAVAASLDIWMMGS